MKKASFRFISILLTIVLMLSLAVVTMAASGTPVTKSGIEASLSTDKDSYATGDTIGAVVTVKNNSGKNADISVAITVPEGLTLSGKANYTATVKNGATFNSSASKTADTAMLAPAAMLGVLAICAVVVLVMFGKTNRAMMSLLLVLAVVGGIGVLAVPAQAAGETIDLTCPIKLDGKDVNVTATIEFTLTDVPAESAALFEDDFADLEGWSDAPAEIPEGATVSVVNGAMNVVVPTSVSAAVGKTHNLDNFTGKVAFEVDVTVNFPEGSPNNKAGAAIMVNTEGGASLAFYIFNGKFGYYNVDRTPSKGVTQLGTNAGNATYHVKMVADTATDTYDIYIDGELLVGGVKFRNNGEKFNKIQLSSGGSNVGATVTFDNLKITVAD